MLCLGRRPGEGVVIDNQYLLVIGDGCGHGIKATLYQKDTDIEPKDIQLNIQEPYVLTSDITITFFGWRRWLGNISEFMSVGIKAPQSVNIVRCELLARQLGVQ